MAGVALVALALVGYSLLARRLEARSITGPIVFVAIGVVLGPSVLDLLPLGFGSSATLFVTEVTLALILFADASTVRYPQLRQDFRLPGRLLSVGLPLTMILGAVAAKVLFPDTTWAAAALIACILAPTDAALGLAVVTNRAVPVRIRRALNVESGLNDGIATPFVTLFLGIVAVEEAGHGDWVRGAVTEIGLGVLVAVVVGVAGGWLLARASAQGWTSPTSEQLAGLGLALLAYTGAVAVGGNGFVAAFVAGLAFGAVTADLELEAVEFTETLGLLGSLLVWGIFGGVVLSVALADGFSLAPVVYAALSLTLIRLVPVAVALVGQRFRPDTIGFIGWFGPRGLASVVFTLLAVEALGGDPFTRDLIEVATWTILLSVILHGLTAGPLGAWYGRRIQAAPSEIPEREAASEPRMRRRALAA
jgi:NhaP-type Na+/H+ or K+/H+ antiporter